MNPKKIVLLLIICQFNCILTRSTLRDAAPGTRTIDYKILTIENLYLEEYNLIVKTTLMQTSEKNTNHESEHFEACFKFSSHLTTDKTLIDTNNFKLCKDRNENINFENLAKVPEYLIINEDLILKSNSFKNLGTFCNCKNFPKDKEVLHIFINSTFTNIFKAKLIVVFKDYTLYMIPNENLLSKVDYQIYLKNIPLERINEYIEKDCIITGNCTYNSIKNYYHSSDYWIRDQNPFIFVKPQVIDDNSIFFVVSKEKEFSEKIFPNAEIFIYKKNDSLFDKNINFILLKDSHTSHEESRKIYKYLKIPFTVVFDIIVTPIIVLTAGVLWGLVLLYR